MVRQGLEIRHKKDLHWISVALWLVVFLIVGLVSWYGYRYFTTGSLPQVLSVGALTADTSVDESAVSGEEAESYTVAADEPRYISIPSLGVDKVRIFKTGVDSNNLLAFPENIHDAGWYQESAPPGQGYGVVLITGHNQGVQVDGAFSRINELSNGSSVVIERGDGEKITYWVEQKTTMSVKEASKTGMKTMLQPLTEVNEELTLVTKAGNWVPKLRQFDQRIIVRAVSE